MMLRKSFESIADAEKSAKLLAHSFAYYSIKSKSRVGATEDEASNDEIRNFLAVGLGYSDWNELLENSHFEKSKSKPSEQEYASLAINLERLMRIPSQFERIIQALRTAMVLETTELKEYAALFFENLPCKTVEQWAALTQISASYRYHSRYSHLRSIQENEKLREWRDNEVAKVLEKQ